MSSRVGTAVTRHYRKESHFTIASHALRHASVRLSESF